jgi:hypothetical protein
MAQVGEVVQDPALSVHGSVLRISMQLRDTQDTGGFATLTQLHAGTSPVGSNA